MSIILFNKNFNLLGTLSHFLSLVGDLGGSRTHLAGVAVQSLAVQPPNLGANDGNRTHIITLAR